LQIIQTVIEFVTKLLLVGIKRIVFSNTGTGQFELNRSTTFIEFASKATNDRLFQQR